VKQVFGLPSYMLPGESDVRWGDWLGIIEGCDLPCCRVAVFRMKVVVWPGGIC
jgi:hypothetical protein